MNVTMPQSSDYEPVSITDALIRSLDLAKKHQGLPGGIPSGYPSLDRLTRGWEPGELVVIGARPAIGKTLLALGMARNAAVRFHVPTAYFSLEMSATELADRLIVSEIGLSMDKLRGQKTISEEEWPDIICDLGELACGKLFIDDSPGPRIGELGDRIRSLADKQGVKVFFIDSFQSLFPDGGDVFSSQSAERADTLRRIKEIAMALDVTIILLTCVWRPTRRNYSGPILADLDSYCPSAEDYADTIILLHRDILGLNTDEESPNLMELRVVRNRNGATGTVDLIFDRERIRLVEPDEFDMPA